MIVGGSGADTIVAGDGDNVVFGDNGRIDVGQTITTSDATFGAGDHITAGAGRDLLLGGAGDDTLIAGGGEDIVLGDHGVVTLDAGLPRFVRTSDFNDGGRDRLEGNDGDDVLVGGSAGDSIDGDAGNDLIFGDQVSLDGRTILDLFHSVAYVAAAVPGGQGRELRRRLRHRRRGRRPDLRPARQRRAARRRRASRTRPRARRASRAPAIRSAR